MKKSLLSICNPYEYSLCKNVSSIFYPFLLKRIYKKNTGNSLNLKNPKRFTEKIQWLKLNENSTEKTSLVDKLSAKKIISERFNDEVKVAEVYGIWDSFDEIDFNSLPERFALKTNHGFFNTAVITDKSIFLSSAKDKANELYEKMLKTNYAFVSGFEMVYKNIVPKIYAEEELPTNSGQIIPDYQFHCFNGVPRIVQKTLLTSEYKHSNFYDLTWKKLNIGIKGFYQENLYYEDIQPVLFDKMLEIAKELSKDFKYARIDLAEIDNKIVFMEATFTPHSGFMQFLPDSVDFDWGNMLNLNNN